MANSKYNFDKPVDLVYLWVDGSDKDWLEKKNRYLPKDEQLSIEATDKCRSRDNNELKFSLRSIEKHLSWINHIYIVTDNQIPKWLDLSNPKISVVFHKDFMPTEILPTFNSNVIEQYLYKIEGLSEHFLYANDDVFVNADLTPNFFFTPDGKPIIRFQQSLCQKRINSSPYAVSVLKMQKLIEEKYDKFFDLEPHHNIDSYTKTLCANCQKEFANEYKISEQNRFRKNNDIQRSIIGFYGIATNQAELKIIPRAEFHLPFGTKLLNKLIGKYRIDSIYLGVSKSKIQKRFEYVNPKLFCLNDTENVTIQNRTNANKLMWNLFTKKSLFESSDIPAISIIIPVYNTEEYIPQCLDSIINQEFKDIEVICVNDGSTDSSKEILDFYAAKDKRIKVIHQENQGVSAARNNGIEAARGEYIMFADADDWLEPNIFEELYRKISCDNSDILIFSHYNVFSKKKKAYDLSKDCKCNIVNYDNLDDLLEKVLYIPAVCWNKVCATSYLKNNNLKFDTNYSLSEDNLFWYDILSKYPKISIINRNYYNYRNIRSGSSMENFDTVLERHYAFAERVTHSDLYNIATEKGKALIEDRNLNFFLWMWMKHKDKRSLIAKILKERLNSIDPKYAELRNYKTAIKRLKKFK